LTDSTFIQSNQPTARPVVITTATKGNKKKVTTAGKTKEAGQGGGNKDKKNGGVRGKKTTAENVA
jgi:hypothetical protein